MSPDTLSSSGLLALPVPSFAVLVMVALLAAMIDLATRRIPNWLTVSGVILGLMLSTWQGGIGSLAASLGGFLLGLALLLPGFLLRMTGGGDVKLMGAVGSLLGPKLILPAFLLYILAGLAWALVYGLYAWVAQGAPTPFARYGAMLRTLWHTGRFAYVRPKPGEAMRQRLPMAPAIAFGAIAAPLIFSF